MKANGVVAAGHPVTVGAADQVLRAGGNAFDAAVAAFFAACVAEPVLASLAGGGFVLAGFPSGRCKLFDFFVQTPQRARTGIDFHPIQVDFGSAQQEFHVGMGACATPGCVRGILQMHASLGRMPLAELVSPACQAAREGVAVNRLQAYIFHLVQGIYATDHARQHLPFAGPAGPVPGEGDVVRSPDLADVIESLAIEGESLFYRGEIAARIVDLCDTHGGHLSIADLRDYAVEVRDPLRIAFRDMHIITNPGPSTGGLLMGFGLRLLESLSADIEFGSYAHLRLLAEAMQQTSDARLRYLNETAGADDQAARRLLDPVFLQQYRECVVHRTRALSGTTHVSIMDGMGNVASMTVSNGEGNGYVVPGTGVMLNNMLGEQDLNPTGFHKWRPNQRLCSMMAPTLARLAGGRTIATGSGGSNRIRTALLQVVLNLAHFGRDLETAIHAPRIHLEDAELNMEGGIADNVVTRLAAEFPEHRVFGALNLFFGGAHSVGRDRCGGFQGVGDPRRGGVSSVSDGG
ncbi:MAG: gamma-glutamyltransferase [Gammaproteobacteria bacterium]|nr:gamma-glutamyltransferase [Gammaproteobacteria bacterium]